MTYWTLIPVKDERTIRPCKVFKQHSQPGKWTKRAEGYPWIHGWKSKRLAILHFDKMGVPNAMRPKGYKSYDV